ncbi:MAG: beta-propeller fold lactonase family protein, partial [Acidobacteriales bacterium]|nr:beta-propeller fold lactonase family protein [Terriglobales bacterium]
PFPTGGTGVSANPDPNVDLQWDSDGEVTINSAGNYLFAVNGHSDNISAFKIGSSGGLTPVVGSPYPSGGSQPASIAIDFNALGNNVSLMVVVNKDSDPLVTATNPSYTSFKVSSTGVLTQDSSYALPAGSSPAQALIEPKSNNFFGMEFLSSQISSYKLNQKGAITPLSSLATLGPVVGAVLHPTVRTLYATLPTVHTIGTFTWNSAGGLSLFGNVNDSGMAVCWDALNAAGTRLYTAETNSSSVTVWDLTNTKHPIQLQHVTVTGTGAKPTHTRVDPTGKFLYVLDRTAVLHVFDIASDGTIAENHTPYNLELPANTVPLGLAVLMK